MCGIAGIYNLDPQRPVDPTMLQRMNETLVHRGPDDEGTYIQGSIGLAARRLKIIDLERGHQPLSNEDGTVWIVFNGEIYNFQVLRQELEGHGHRFMTSTDTEVVVHAYEQYGQDCVHHLRGMFAFVIWDGRRRRLFLARDRVGQKPLYYLLNHQGLIFGSELKALLATGQVERRMDLQAVNDCLTYQYVPAPRTIFQGVSKLPAAHWMTLDTQGQLHQERYWRPEYPTTGTSSRLSDQEYAQQLLDLLRESVQMRLISDVPLGAFLSGGIDSSIIVALMTQVSSKQVKTFSIGFEEEAYDERPYARQVADFLGTEHHEYIVKPDAVELLPRLVQSFDEPFADHSAIPMYYLSQMARQEVTVCLSGDGGDEIFAGYNAYADALRPHRSDVVPLWLKRGLIHPLYTLWPERSPGKRLLFLLSATPVQRHGWNTSSSSFQISEKPHLFSRDLRCALHDGYNSYELLEAYAQEVAHQDLVTQLQHVDLMTYLPDDILVKVDRTSMLHSLEARAPLLDHKVVEFMATLPSSLKFREGVSKYILRQAAVGLVPQEVIQRPKKGFSAPLSSWFRGDSQAFIREMLLDGRLSSRGFFDMNYVNQIVQRHLSGEAAVSRKIWTLLVFEQWCQTYLDQGQGSG